MTRQIRCPYCKGAKIVKRGLSPTQNRGKQQRYRCNTCRRTFIKDMGFWKMKNSPEKITAGIDLYFSNLSSRKVRNHFRRHWEHNASHVSILDWCRKYTLKVQKYVDTLQPQLSGEYYADETEIDRRKNKDIFWCNVDWGTRYINATLYSPLQQSVNEAINFLEKVKKHGKPKYIQTDAAKFYPKAMRKMFYNIHLKAPNSKRMEVEHRIINHHKTGKHNVRIETVFSKIKDRVDDFRGLKALWSAPILMAGIVIQHNFIEEHTTTGKLPAELAGLNLNIGKNRWLGIIENAYALNNQKV